MTGERPDYWTGLALALPGGQAVLLDARAAGLIVGCLQRYAKLEGVPLTPAAEHVRRVCLSVASQAARGHAAVRKEADPSESGAWITTAEVAEHLGLSQRQCTRLATESDAFGKARRVRNKWMVRQDEVTAYAGRGETDDRDQPW